MDRSSALWPVFVMRSQLSVTAMLRIPPDALDDSTVLEMGARKRYVHSLGYSQKVSCVEFRRTGLLIQSSIMVFLFGFDYFGSNFQIWALTG